MSQYITREAEKRLHNCADNAAAQFETTIMRNRVHEQVGGQHTTEHPLAALFDAIERVYNLSNRDDIDAETSFAATNAGNKLNRRVYSLRNQQIARVCAEVILDGDGWTDIWDESEIQAAQDEAWEWVGNHPDAADALK